MDKHSGHEKTNFWNHEDHTDFCDHRCRERRKVSSQGYTYISTVGWICRREHNRRMDDASDCDDE